VGQLAPPRGCKRTKGVNKRVSMSEACAAGGRVRRVLTPRALPALLLALIACTASEPGSLSTNALPALPSQAAHGKCPRRARLDVELPTWDLYVGAEAWAELHEDVTAEVQVDALLCVADRAYPIALELQGASSRKHKKKSFDLKFSKAQPLAEAPFGEPELLRRILLKGMAIDPTLIREALAFEAFARLGYTVPRVGFTNLRINGTYWGLYNLVEPINEDFLARHGFAEGGHLYKAVRTKQGRADFKPGRDLHTGFEDKSEQASDDWPDLTALATKLQRTPLRHDAFLRDIDSTFPLAAYIDRMIWIAVTQNGDAVAQNFYLYNSPVAGLDAWTMFPWDSNVAFGSHWSDPTIVLPPENAPMVVDGGSYFGGRLLQVPELRTQYIARFFALLDGELSSERLLAQTSVLADLVRHDLALNQQRWSQNLDPDEAFEVVETFLRARPDVLREELHALEEADAGAP
jgi:hypothetical protein